MRIRTKILIQNTILFLVIILIASGLIYQSTSDALATRLDAQLESITVLKQHQLDHIIHQYTDNIEDISNESFIHTIINYYSEDSSSVSSEQLSESEKTFLKWKNHSDFTELFIIDAIGQVIYSSDKNEIGKIKTNEPYFKQGQKNTFYQSYYFDISKQDQSMMMATPIISNDATVYVLAGRINLQIINDIMIERSGLGETGETYLVNTINLLVTESIYDKNLSFKKFIFTPGVNKAMDGENNSGIYTNYIGKTVIGYYQWDETLGACLVTEITYDEAFASLYSLINTIIITMIVFFLISLFFIYLFSRRLSRPIEKLTKITKEIGKQKKKSFIMPKVSKDELGDLTTAFHTMIQDLNKAQSQIDEYQSHLESRINERTIALQNSKAELEKKIKEQKMTKIALLNMMKDLNHTVEELQTAKNEINTKNKDLKKTQKELRKINKHLEEIVAERTNEVKLLLKQKDEFIHQLGHDLKNPLGPIVNLLPLLEKKIDDNECKDIVNVLKRNARYMKNLVTKTLELAQLNSPNTKLNMESFNLTEELDGIIKKNTFLFEEKNMKVVNHISEDIMIHADKLKMEEVYTNLINNAVKYSENNGNLYLDAQIINDEIVFSIKDEGIGMNPEELNHLFDEFYKADSSRHDFDSSGLGMPIAKRIIEKHGGKIWAESEGPGRGSTFYFTLPKNEQSLNGKKET